MNWPAYAVHEAHPICRQVARADEWAAQGTRFEGAAQNRRVYAVCDAAFLNLQGVPSIVYGPGSLLVPMRRTGTSILRS